MTAVSTGAEAEQKGTSGLRCVKGSFQRWYIKSEFLLFTVEMKAINLSERKAGPRERVFHLHFSRHCFNKKMKCSLRLLHPSFFFPLVLVLVVLLFYLPCRKIKMWRRLWRRASRPRCFSVNLHYCHAGQEKSGGRTIHNSRTIAL